MGQREAFDDASISPGRRTPGRSSAYAQSRGSQQIRTLGRVIGTDGKLIAFYPASIGRSENFAASIQPELSLQSEVCLPSDRTPHCPTWPEQPGGRRSRRSRRT